MSDAVTVTDEMVRAGARAMQIENRPKNDPLNGYQREAIEDETLGNYLALARPCISAALATQPQDQRIAELEAEVAKWKKLAGENFHHSADIEKERFTLSAKLGVVQAERHKAQDAEERIREDERERCAKIADGLSLSAFDPDPYDDWQNGSESMAREIAKAIRASKGNE